MAAPSESERRSERSKQSTTTASTSTTTTTTTAKTTTATTTATMPSVEEKIHRSKEETRSTKKSSSINRTESSSLSSSASSPRRHRSRSRSESTERKHSSRTRSRSRSESSDPKHKKSTSKEKSKSFAGTPSPRIHKSDEHKSSSNENKRRERSRSVEKDKEEEKKRDPASSSRSRGKSSRSSRDKSRDEESKRREPSRSRGKSVDKSEEEDSPRKRKSSKERPSRRSSYIKSTSTQKKEKVQSDDRKSSVLGSLHAFLEEGKASAPVKEKESGDRSVVSSASRLRRKRNTSMPSGSASVYGGYATSREETRQRRRSRSTSASITSSKDAESSVDRRKELRRERSTTSRTRSQSRSRGTSRSRHSSLPIGNEARELQSQLPQPSDRPPTIGDSTTRPQRRMSMTSSNGAEIPPGFPVAAVDKTAAPTVPTPREEISGRASPSVLESTAKIRERQQRRLSTGFGESSLSSVHTDASNLRKMRRRASMDIYNNASLSAPPSNDLSHGEDDTPTHSSSPALPYNTPNNLDASLNTNLAMVGAKASSRAARKEGSAATAPTSSDKHRKRSSSKKRGSESRSKQRSKIMSSKPGDELVQDGLSPDTTDKRGRKEKSRKSSLSAEDLMGASVASLDPSLLLEISKPVRRISSIAELYAGEENNNNDDDESGRLQEDSPRDDSAAMFHKQYGTPSRLNQSVVSIDLNQLNQVAAMFSSPTTGPGNISPYSSSLSGTSDGSKSPGVLRRKVGQATAESPKFNKRVSWVELPWNNPEQLVIKSTDTDGKNERETSASADAVSAVDDLTDDKKIAEAVKSAEERVAETVNKSVDERESTNNKKAPKEKNNRSLDVAFEKDEKERKKKGSRDERTVGTMATSNTNTSESTFKTTNRSATPPAASPHTIPDETHQHSIRAEDLGRLQRSGSSSSLSRSGLRRSRDMSSDGSSSTFSRRHKEDDPSEKKVRRSSSKVSSRSKDRISSRKEDSSSSKDSKVDSVERERSRRRGDDKERSGSDPAATDRKHRSHRNPDGESSKVVSGSKSTTKIKYIPKDGTIDSQSSGEPTVEKSTAGNLQRNPSLDLDSPSLVPRRKSYLNRRTLMREEKEKSQQAKSSVKNSLDHFLARLKDDDDDELNMSKEDFRSVYSDSRQKAHKNRMRERKEESDDRSVLSAPNLNARSRRLALARNAAVRNNANENLSSRMKKLDVAF